MTVEERLAQLEEIIEIMMDDPAVNHKITVARLMAKRNKNPIRFEIKANYQ
jgi:TusA-related sulfurtransferase